MLKFELGFMWFLSYFESCFLLDIFKFFQQTETSGSLFFLSVPWGKDTCTVICGPYTK